MEVLSYPTLSNSDRLHREEELVERALEDRRQREREERMVVKSADPGRPWTDYTECRAALSAIQAITAHEEFPPPTMVRARCTDCEYRNFCADVF